MSDDKYRRSRRKSVRRSSRNRYRTPDGELKQMMEVMLGRLAALEQRSQGQRESRARDVRWSQSCVGAAQ